jgi:hypothetical protein
MTGYALTTDDTGGTFDVSGGELGVTGSLDRQNDWQEVLG